MRGVLLTEHGGPEVLECTELATPEPRPGQVLVELRTAGINRRDALIRAGIGPGYRPQLPVILGSDGAGIRRDTGEEVVILPSLRWGDDDRVPGPDYALLGGGPDGGTYAELVAVDADCLFPKPRHLAWAEAGALSLSGVTAYRALFTVGQLRAGQTLVILGAGSGVSLIALQLAVKAGARVAVTSSSRDKLNLAQELGAAAGVDYTEPDWELRLRDEIGEADLVLDSVGSTLQESVHLLRRGGAVLSMGGTGDSGIVTDFDIRTLYLQHKRVLGTVMGSPRDFAAFLAMVADGDIDPVIDSVYPLDEVADAHAQLDSNLRFGKIVLTTD
ncbi:quinone oxidoreductase family protein [Brevibacterium ihuae]|uniref:quinone oxidoreductase family protein n=1 Tax=Brevibacterium ihuae TaxID=1631743 RepID=UPI000C780A22|nr:zinc-binding dehydrogenase [Brevibacterium ihuae]